MENREYELLTEWAAKSREAVRDVCEQPCEFRTAFQRDRDRILHSKSFRRLKQKTQVYIATGDHYRTRMTHSLEVAQISRTIARGLGLNEDLVEAIALGHDVGHTPFGHAGEEALCELVGNFHHNEQSLRVVEYLEKNGKGLNLTTLVRDGILKHTGAELPLSQEGMIVRTSDRIAYLCHDFDDGMRAGLLKQTDLPEIVRRNFGESQSRMITAMVSDIINYSRDKNEVAMSAEVISTMEDFRQFMFEKVYRSEQLKPERNKAAFILQNLYRYFYKHREALPQDFLQREKQWGRRQIVIDYIAGLTDLYAVQVFENIFVPQIHALK